MFLKNLLSLYRVAREIILGQSLSQISPQLESSTCQDIAYPFRSAGTSAFCE
jgi:hypothetical protein